jgi:rubrerythrin
MTEKYTPTPKQAQDAYVRAMRDSFIASEGEHKEEFDRMLAGVRADTLDEAAEKLEDGKWPENFLPGAAGASRELRERADLIRTNGETNNG